MLLSEASFEIHKGFNTVNKGVASERWILKRMRQKKEFA